MRIVSFLSHVSTLVSILLVSSCSMPTP